MMCFIFVRPASTPSSLPTTVGAGATGAEAQPASNNARAAAHSDARRKTSDMWISPGNNARLYTATGEVAGDASLDKSKFFTGRRGGGEENLNRKRNLPTSSPPC